MVDVRPLDIDGVLELRPRRFADERGFFSEVWRQEWLAAVPGDFQFVQDNHSHSSRRGVLRGLHFQVAPMAQHKLVRVTRGAIFDVAVDLRSQSQTFRKWVGITLSADEWNQLFIPSGFAHGFLTLEEDSEVLYKVSASYSPEHERTLRYDDPDIGIDWPLDPEDFVVSQKDREAPTLKDIGRVF